MISGFAARAPLSELMDDPGCNETLLLRTVRQFASINRLVGRYRTILRYHVLMDMQREPDREYHLLDMGLAAATSMSGCSPPPDGTG